MNLIRLKHNLTSSFKAGLVLLAIGSISACSSDNQFADIKQFMAEIEKKPKGDIPPLPEFESYQPFSYAASNRRSPFEPPVVVPPETEQQRRNVGVKPPSDHVKQYLERFELSSLDMVGTLQQDNDTWALIQDPEGGVHRVQVGDYLGTNWGKIESIEETQIDVTEIVSDGADGWLRRPRTVELRGVGEG